MGCLKNSDWKRHIAEQAKSDLSVREYCELYNLSVPSFYQRKKDSLSTVEGPSFVQILPDAKDVTIRVKVSASGEFQIHGSLRDLGVIKELLRSVA